MRKTTRQDIVELVAGLGVSPGDRLMVHSFLPSLGIVEDGLAGLAGALREVLGPDGTLLVPTFTYSFRRDEVFDIRNSKSTVGAFTEYVRKGAGAVRSACPLFSMAGIGPDAARLLERHSSACFGVGSVFETLFDNDVKFLGLGVDYNQGFSFCMHLEKLAGIPQRQSRTFRGDCLDWEGRQYQDEAVHFVRVDDPPWQSNRRRLCERLATEGIIREAVVDGCDHRLFESNTFQDAILDHLARDPWSMADRI
jgi:aminoglycoside 3-N-acetyltransferase